MTEPRPSAPADGAPPADAGRFRATLVRVLLVQVATLLALWMLQQRYAP